MGRGQGSPGGLSFCSLRAWLRAEVAMHGAAAGWHPPGVVISGMWPSQGHTARGGQLVVVLSAVRAWTPVVTRATTVQVLHAPVREGEGEGLAPRDTRPLEEAASPRVAWPGGRGASWPRGEERGQPDTPEHLALSLPGDLVSQWVSWSGTRRAG